MSSGQAFVDMLPLKQSFYDRHERRVYLRAIEIAKRIVDDPSLIGNAMSFLERHMAPDPHQRAAYEIWKQLLAASPTAIARALLQDSERGAELRASAPVFVVVGGDNRIEVLL